ncbi:hypothetical protein GOP47_0002554 [Adiantum capillus-veneris]|uniref:Uncharacterized protein n=1 Tax=Adiantum capillus-veneris TaxID=13818 RepID=A0A9D4ZR21_ADICA|nr:hypothetical protein GOP47_0002554 [Adiantum capillus-veneris]
MPPRRKGTSVTHEHRPDGNASTTEDSHGMVRQNQDKRSVGKDINRPRTGVDEHKQVEQPQQGMVAPGLCQGSSRRRSNVSTLGQSTTVLPVKAPNTTVKMVQSSLKLKGGLDSVPEPKLDQALNLRISTRPRKLVCYNEQSPSHPNNKISSTASKPKAKAAVKRNASSQLLLSDSAKRAKEDPASSTAETLTLAQELTSHVKGRRTRDQELKSLQSDVDKDSAVFAPTTFYMKGMGRTRHQGPKSLQYQIDENSVVGMPCENILLLQTRTKPPKEQNGETAAKSKALEDKKSVTATKQEKKSNILISKNAKMDSAHTAHNQRKKRVSKKVAGAPQDQEMLDEYAGLPMAAAEGNAQDSPTSEFVDEKSSQVHKLVDGSENKETTMKEIKRSSRQIAMANAAQRGKVCLPNAVDVEPREVCSIPQSMHAEKNISSITQKGSSAALLKRTLSGAQVDKEGNTDHNLLLDCKSALKGGVQEFSTVNKWLQSQTQEKGRKTVTRKIVSSRMKGDEVESASVTESAEIESSRNVETNLKSLEKGGLQESINGDKNQQCQTRTRGRKPVTRKGILLATRGDEMEYATVLGIPSVLANNDESSIGDNKHHADTQQKEKEAASRKRTLQGGSGAEESNLGTPLIQVGSIVEIKNVCNAIAMDDTTQIEGRSRKKRTMLGSTQHSKKLKTSNSLCLHTQPLASSEQKLVQETEDAENQQCYKAIKGVDSQDWAATDLTNLGRKIEGSSEKKRKEEGKRKRAMKFDALPVGFGLGISCWSPSPPKCQGLELQESIGVSEFDDQPRLMSPGETEEQPLLQEDAMLEDTSNFISGKMDMKAQPTNGYRVPSSETELRESSPSQTDVKLQCGKVKVKRQVGGKTKKTNTILDASPKLVAARSSGDMWEEKGRESGIDGSKIKRQLSSAKGAATTRSKRLTRRTKHC